MPDVTGLQRGGIVPHFSVRTMRGEVFDYSAIWQRKNLVLVTIAAGDSADPYVRGLQDRDADFTGSESVCVVTRDPVAGLPAPGALVADRWGEIVHVAAPADSAGLPAAQELVDWVAHLEHRCPECEGEAR